MKKLKKLTMMSVLGLIVTMVTACGGTAAKPDDPITDLSLNPPSYLLVGSTFNLDDYVTVTGGKGANDFTATVTEDTKDNVRLSVVPGEEHKATVLKEGAISFNIVAGDYDYLWTTTAMSEIKYQYKQDTQRLGKNFGFNEIDEETGEIAPYIIHNDEYIWFAQWTSEGNTVIPGGIIRTAQGYTHFFTMYGDTADDLEVDVEKKADLDLYYVAGEYALLYTELNTTSVILEDEDGKEYKQDALMVEGVPETQTLTHSSAAGAKEGTQFEGTVYNFSEGVTSFIEYNIGINLYVEYTFKDILLYPLMDNSGVPTGEWYIEMEVLSCETNRSAGHFYFILLTDPDDCKVQACEDYILEEREPEALNYDMVPTLFDSFEVKKNYTMTTTVSFIDSTGNKDTVITDDSWDSDRTNLYNGMKEVTKVNGESMLSVLTTKDGEELDKFGFKKDGNDVKVYGYDDTGAFINQVVEGATTIWDPNFTMTTACLNSDSNSYVPFEIFNSEGDLNYQYIIKFAGNACPNWANNFLAMTDIGHLVKGIGDFVTFKEPYTILDELDFTISFNDCNDVVITVRSAFYLDFEKGELNNYGHCVATTVFSAVGTTTVPQF